MNRTNEITLLPNPAHHTLDHNGYVKSKIVIDDGYTVKIILITYNKEYFN